MRVGEAVAPVVALLGQLVQQRPAGVGDAHGSRSLIKSLSRGVIAGAAVSDDVWKVDALVEKPALEDAPSNLAVFGRYLLSPRVMELLADVEPGVGGEIQLTDAMAEYARTRGGMTAVEFTGKHYDMGNKLKVVEAQVELALQHPEIGEAFRDYLKEFCKTL